MALVADLSLVLLAALAGGFLAQRLGQPLMVGYVLAGVLVGPFTGGLTVVNVHDIEQLAELGVALLLFSLGLELSFRELKPVRAVALGGATIQIVLTIALGLALGLALGWEWRPALWFGALISLSSTMVVLKTIQAQGRLGTLSSRVMFGILIVQDLAVVPLMIVLPELSDPAGGLVRVGAAALRAFLLLGVIVLVATRLVPRLMAFVARWNSRELFLLSTMTLAFGVGYVTWSFGLSMALGAFVAGLVINESEYAHQALSDIVPLRDLFGMLFFVSVGMLLDPALVWQQIGALILVVIAIVVGKAAILAGVVRAFGYWNVVPLAVGLTLFQVGEFAFVLARVGLSAAPLATMCMHSPSTRRSSRWCSRRRCPVSPPWCMNVSGRVAPERHSKRSIFPVRGCRIMCSSRAGGVSAEALGTRSRICICHTSWSSSTTVAYGRPARQECLLSTATPARPSSSKPQA